MKRWPWITTALAAVLVLSPVGQSFLTSAFSGEQLSRNIAQPILLIALLILAALGALEWWIGWLLRRQRRIRRDAAGLD